MNIMRIMKKHLITFFFIFAILFTGGLLKASAEETTSTPTQINARILPLIWYSTLSINDGDSIKIYAGIQNNSGLDFTGIATFYIDDQEISNSPFTSKDGGLISVATNWMANPGSHNIQVKITTSLPSNKTLVSSESAKANVSITQKITQEVIKNTIINTVTNVITKVNEVTSPITNKAEETIVTKLENLKKPINTTQNIDNSNNTHNVAQKEKGTVLGASTESTANLKTASNNKINSIFNTGIDGLIFLVKNWIWTLGVIILILIIIKIKRRNKK